MVLPQQVLPEPLAQMELETLDRTEALPLCPPSIPCLVLTQHWASCVAAVWLGASRGRG